MNTAFGSLAADRLAGDARQRPVRSSASGPPPRRPPAGARARLRCRNDESLAPLRSNIVGECHFWIRDSRIGDLDIGFKDAMKAFQLKE